MGLLAPAGLAPWGGWKGMDYAGMRACGQRCGRWAAWLVGRISKADGSAASGPSKMVPIIKAYRDFLPIKKPRRIEQGFFISRRSR
jgi:hypothetical protein